eukprot:363820_1
MPFPLHVFHGPVFLTPHLSNAPVGSSSFLSHQTPHLSTSHSMNDADALASDAHPKVTHTLDKSYHQKFPSCAFDASPFHIHCLHNPLSNPLIQSNTESDYPRSSLCFLIQNTSSFCFLHHSMYTFHSSTSITA